MALLYGEDKLHEKLEEIANSLVAEGKGILCADETVRTFAYMFNPIGVANDEENRRSYRELLFTTPRLSKYISGVLMSEEALGQKSIYGVPFPELLAEQGVLPGITVDKAFTRIPFTQDEWTSRGLDLLPERCARFYELGCRFTRWRCAFVVDSEIRPTPRAVQTSLLSVARYASIAQQNGLVPIVEASLSASNSSYSVNRSASVLAELLNVLFYLLQEYKVHLAGTVLRIGMAMPGERYPVDLDLEGVAEATFLVLQQRVPPAVAGITFLSGDQRMEEITTLLDHINRIGGRKPWNLTFCFGRPLQVAVLFAWLDIIHGQGIMFENKIGIDEMRPASQRELWRRAKENSHASLGVYLQKKQEIEEAYNREC